MLDLKRASAGSGKTHALAKYYIKCLIGVREKESIRYRLRRPDELMEGLRSILAITFTNKATNEMQMRIVDRLDGLGQYRSGKYPVYMEDFVSEFDFCDAAGNLLDLDEQARVRLVSERSAQALRLLLNHYSEFNVSTIDSFFQTVLRTLAYEVNVPQAYQVEMESDYVSRMGLNAVLDDVDSSKRKSDPAVAEAAEWIRILLMGDKSSRWNIYEKQDTGGIHSSNYRKLLDKFGKIDNEDYRKNRHELEEYLREEDLRGLYLELEKIVDDVVTDAYDGMHAVARRIEGLCQDPECRQSARSNAGKPYARAVRALSFDKWKVPNESLAIKPIERTKGILKLCEDPEWETRFDAADELCESYEAWIAVLEDPVVRLWRALRDNFPFLGLLKAVSERRREYLGENSAVELGETSFILSQFFKDDIAPFVYERMGMKLHHYLIDEFQDTSRLQWENLRPLLVEGGSTGYDSLIIGDAKQSIYRFRNADPTLITNTLPEDKDLEIREETDARRANRNWRSERDVVQWNNCLFEYIARHIADVAGPRDKAEDVGIKFGNLYSNVRQDIQKDFGGYVCFDLLNEKLDVSDKADEDAIGGELVTRVLDLIINALDRGYDQKDIAVLTQSNDAGTSVIEAMRKHNALNKGRTLEFVSEQSLLIGNSMAVQRVETVLGAISRGSLPRRNDPEEFDRRGVGNIRELGAALMLYQQMQEAGRHNTGETNSEESPQDYMRMFREEALDVDPIREMLDSLQSTALPALVEAVVERFVPENLKRLDAPFLAAFQDCVLEYCQGHSSDLPSFLKWWSRRRMSRSISSPEDMDAIKVMTIHKSKGLEFPVVIIPQPLKKNAVFGDYTGGRDWRWVPKEDLSLNENELSHKLPPYMPVRISGELQGTSLEKYLQEQYNAETMDALNMIYVGFTRAVSELYVFAPDVKEPANTKSLRNFVDSFVNDTLDSEDPVLVHSRLVIEETDKYRRVEYGQRPDHKLCDDEDKEEKKPAGILEAYESVSIPPEVIRCRIDSLPDGADDEGELSNPRMEGTICHGIMEDVLVASDMPRALAKARISGLLGAEAERHRLGERLMARVCDNPDARVRRWFGGGAEKVYVERPLLRSDIGMKRPDRIMIWPDGSVDVIDYKFGANDPVSGPKYHKQVRDYMSWLRQSGKYGIIRGWLWYVFYSDSSDLIEKVAEF